MPEMRERELETSVSVLPTRSSHFEEEKEEEEAQGEERNGIDRDSSRQRSPCVSPSAARGLKETRAMEGSSKMHSLGPKIQSLRRRPPPPSPPRNDSPPHPSTAASVSASAVPLAREVPRTRSRSAAPSRSIGEEMRPPPSSSSFPYRGDNHRIASKDMSGSGYGEDGELSITLSSSLADTMKSNTARAILQEFLGHSGTTKLGSVGQGEQIRIEKDDVKEKTHNDRERRNRKRSHVHKALLELNNLEL